MTLYPGVALVTGAASGTLSPPPTVRTAANTLLHTGIGRAVATSIATEGCTRIAIADLSEDGLRETGELIKSASPSSQEVKVHVQRVNVLNESEVGGFVESVVDVFGRVDYGVNCAGTRLPRSLRLTCAC